MKRLTKISIFIGSFAVAIGAFSHSFSLVSKGANTGAFSFSGGSITRNVRFYTGYNGTSWNTYTDVSINEGSAISLSDIPNVSLSGYTFKGWNNNVPSISNYSYTASSSIAGTVVNTDLTYYPILKCNTKQVYTNSNSQHCYYNLNETVTISYRTLKKTVTGYRYVGFDGIPSTEVISSYDNDRNLQSENGRYVFFEDNGGVFINREIGVHFTSGIWNDKEWEHDFIKFYKTGESEEVRKLYYKSSDVVGKYIVIYADATKESMQLLRMGPDYEPYYQTQWNYSKVLNFSNYSSTNWLFSITGWDNSSSWVSSNGKTEATSNWGYD